MQERFIKATPELVVSAIQQIEAGTVKPTKQSGKPFHYTPAKPEWDELIDWTEPAKRIFDKVRARTPGPANFYLFEDRMHFVLSVELEPLLLPNPVQPGQVIKRDKRGVLVKTGDTGIWLTKIRTEDGTEMVPNHRVGTMLRYNLVKEIYELRKRVK